MTVRGRGWGVTTHACERYVERIDDTVDELEARYILSGCARRSVLVAMLPDGTELYRDPHRPNRLEIVVVNGRVVTVIDPQVMFYKEREQA